jgi:hypothetical protein
MTHSQGFDQAHSTTTHRSRPAANQPAFPKYRVGEPFRRSCRAWPDGAQFRVGAEIHELTLFHSEIHEDLVDDVRRGPAEFALIVKPSVIVLMYRFRDSIPWSDIPYSWHLQQDEGRTIPALANSPEFRSLLWITLVSANGGMICAQRGMTLSPGFTRALHNAVRAQALSGFDPQECTAGISQIYLTSFGAVDRLTMAAARTLGNS